MALIRACCPTNQPAWESTWRIAAIHVWQPDPAIASQTDLLKNMGPWLFEFTTAVSGDMVASSSRPLASADHLGHNWSSGELQFHTGTFGASRPRLSPAGEGPIQLTLTPQCPTPAAVSEATEGLLFDRITDHIQGLADAAERWILVRVAETKDEVTLTFRYPDPDQVEYWVTISKTASPQLLGLGERSTSPEWTAGYSCPYRFLDWRPVEGVTLPWRMESFASWAAWSPVATPAERPEGPDLIQAAVYDRTSLAARSGTLDGRLADILRVPIGTDVDDKRYDLHYLLGSRKLNWGGRVFEGPPIDQVLLDPMKWIELAEPRDVTRSSRKRRDPSVLPN